MRALIAAITVAVLAIAGCASESKPSPEVMAKADCGTPISQSDAERLATVWLDASLKDPESKRVKWDNVQRGYERANGESGDWVFGYRLLAAVNAKNSYGGYAGSSPYVFMFHDGKLIAVFTTQTHVSRYGVRDSYERVY